MPHLKVKRVPINIKFCIMVCMVYLFLVGASLIATGLQLFVNLKCHNPIRNEIQRSIAKAPKLIWKGNKALQSHIAIIEIQWYTSVWSDDHFIEFDVRYQPGVILVFYKILLHLYLEQHDDWKHSVQRIYMKKRIKKQARKPQSYASLKLRLTDRLTGVKCRVTSVAKNL